MIIESWVLDFIPGSKVVQRMIIWIRLPGLPMKFWEHELLMGIASKASTLVVMDEFTTKF